MLCGRVICVKIHFLLYKKKFIILRSLLLSLVIYQRGDEKLLMH